MSDTKATDKVAEETAQAPTPDKINYENYQLDPSKEVLVPLSTYIALTNVVQQVEREHSKRIRSDKYAWFNKKTHQKLSAKNAAKMKPEKLQKEYYENIDYDATDRNIRVDRDELGSAAIRLMGEFRGVFQLNIDRGNRMLRPEVAAAMQQQEQANTDPALEDSSDEAPVVKGPTLVKDES